MEKKITKKEMFAKIKEVVAAYPEMVEFIDHEVELLNKKNSAERKPTANQVENEKIKDFLLANMTAGKEYTATQLIKEVLADTVWKDLSVSRVTAIVTQLVQDNSLVRDYKKRVAYFSLIA